MLPLRARVNLGAMAMKRYSAFPKAPALLEPHHRIVQCHIQGGSYPLQKCSRCILLPQSAGLNHYEGHSENKLIFIAQETERVKIAEKMLKKNNRSFDPTPHRHLGPPLNVPFYKALNSSSQYLCHWQDVHNKLSRQISDGESPFLHRYCR